MIIIMFLCFICFHYKKIKYANLSFVISFLLANFILIFAINIEKKNSVQALEAGVYVMLFLKFNCSAIDNWYFINFDINK
jgi:hypothetical protein